MKTVFSGLGVKTVFVFVLSCICLPSEGISQQKMRERPTTFRETDGFTIRVMRLEGGSFGYEIRKGSEVLVRERRNPYTGTMAGLANTEDAMKTATWLVNTVLKKEQMLPKNKRLPSIGVSGRSIPAAVARELGIAVE